jgi:L-ascorbate metabolism protein UlaG (beta-lactamase superfamily)
MSTIDSPAPETRVIAIGGPTALLEIGGLRFLTDPTFDPPGSYEPRPGAKLTKTRGPALTPDEVGSVDAVLLSHDHHLDNLDVGGRAFLDRVPTVLTTVSGAGRLGSSATALEKWSQVEVARPDGRRVRITGVPAQHGPDGSEDVVGEVTGFILAGDGLPTVYFSGDNASVHVVREIAARVDDVEIAVLNAGGAQMPYFENAFLTLSSELAAEATVLLDARVVVPLHFDGWAHFSEGADALRRAFESAGLSERLVLLEPGQAATLDVAAELPAQS